MNQTVKYIISSLRGYIADDELCATALFVAEETTKLSRTEVLCKDTLNIDNLETIISRLRRHEPVQYIFSHTEWHGLNLKVTPATLIPRPETAELVDWVNAENFDKCRVLDIGTGSGCIAIAVKKAHPNWQVAACDISAEALQVAQTNAQMNTAEINFFQCDILNNEIDDYDIIVSNPPYIADNQQNIVDKNVLMYEPHSALFVPQTDPLLFYRRMASIKKSRQLFFEINPFFAREMYDMLCTYGYSQINIRNDIEGKQRFIRATWL